MIDLHGRKSNLMGRINNIILKYGYIFVFFTLIDFPVQISYNFNFLLKVIRFMVEHLSMVIHLSDLSDKSHSILITMLIIDNC